MVSDVQALALAIKRAQWHDHRALDRGLRGVGSTLAQFDALRAIDARPGASGHELAEATFQSDQSFHTLATRLLRQGLIEREHGHGRRLEHHLTAAGRDVVRRGAEVADTVFAASFAALSDRERGQLLRLLARVGAGGGR